MSKFTPGPWQVTRGGTGTARSVADHLGNPILRWDSLMRGRGMDAEANALLIAAAPALHAALLSCKQHLQLAMDQWSPSRGVDADDDSILNSIERSLDEAAVALSLPTPTEHGK